MANSVGIVVDCAITNDLLAQVTRDLLVLKAEFDVDLYDPERKVPASLLSTLKVSYTDKAPDLHLVYKVGEEWPAAPDGVVVKRDLCPSSLETKFDADPKIGYYLKPQGRDIPSLAEQYLNRAYPKGTGIVNPMIVMLWG